MDEIKKLREDMEQRLAEFDDVIRERIAHVMPKNAASSFLSSEGHLHRRLIGSESGGIVHYDMSVSPNWTVPDGTVLTVAGQDSEVYKTIGAAMTAAAALAAGAHTSFIINGGTYAEVVSVTVPSGATNWDIHGVGTGEVIWNPTANSQTLLTLSGTTGNNIRIRGITFSLLSFTGCTGYQTGGSGQRLHFDSCRFTSSSAGTGISYTLEAFITAQNCTFDGTLTTGVSSVTNSVRAVFDGCFFGCVTGATIQGTETTFSNCAFNCSSRAISYGTATCVQMVTIGCQFTTSGILVNVTGVGGVQSLLIDANDFRCTATPCIDFSSLTQTSDGITVTNNLLRNGGGGNGIILDAQMNSGLIANNTFEGFVSGNEISGTGGTDLDVFHNISDAGVIADSGSPVGHMTTGAATPRYNVYSTAGNLDSWLEGAAIASAATLTLGTDGDMFHVTGTTTITAIATPTRQTLVLLIFDGAVTLTYGANLLLHGGADYLTVAGDTFIFAWEGGTVWREVSRRTDRYTDLGIINTPATPASSFGRLFFKDTGGGVPHLSIIDTFGTETDLHDKGGGGAAMPLAIEHDEPTLSDFWVPPAKIWSPRFNIFDSGGQLDSWVKGANLASTNTLTLGNDGDLFHVTGTTTINLIATPTRHTLVLLVFDAALLLVHGTGDNALFLANGINFTTAANDSLIFAFDGTLWREVNRHLAAPYTWVQHVIQPDEAPLVAIDAGAQTTYLHSGPLGETAVRMYADLVQAAVGTPTFTVEFQYADTDDLDTATWGTVIASTAMAGAKSTLQDTMTTAAIPANRLIRLNITSVAWTTTAPHTGTFTLRCKRVT